MAILLRADFAIDPKSPADPEVSLQGLVDGMRRAALPWCEAIENIDLETMLVAAVNMQEGPGLAEMGPVPDGNELSRDFGGIETVQFSSPDLYIGRD